MLGVDRSSDITTIKKSYKRMSLSLHPDKNKSPSAAEEFARVRQAYDTLSSPSLREQYELFGHVRPEFDHRGKEGSKTIMLQIMVHYGVTSVFTFLVTVSQNSGRCMSFSFFLLALMMMIEIALLFRFVQVPVTQPFSSITPACILHVLHAAYPLVMNGYQSISTAEDSQFAQPLPVLQHLNFAIDSNYSLLRRLDQLRQRIKQKDIDYDRVSKRAEGGAVSMAIENLLQRSLQVCSVSDDQREDYSMRVVEHIREAQMRLQSPFPVQQISQEAKDGNKPSSQTTGKEMDPVAAIVLYVAAAFVAIYFL